MPDWMIPASLGFIAGATAMLLLAAAAMAVSDATTLRTRVWSNGNKRFRLVPEGEQTVRLGGVEFSADPSAETRA